jgi:gas vesicle protein
LDSRKTEEARVMDNSRAIAASVVGAVIGGVVGYLFFSEHGRSLRRQIEPALDDLSRELASFRSTVQKASGVANESWKLLSETLGDSERQPLRYPNTHQSSPF